MAEAKSLGEKLPMLILGNQKALWCLKYIK